MTRFTKGLVLAVAALLIGSMATVPASARPNYFKEFSGHYTAVKGAAEYEMLVEAKYPVDKPEVIGQGRVRMGPQLVAHLLMIALIILGNVAMIASRNRGGAR